MNAPGRLLALALAAGFCLPAAAQTYRWVDPASGRIVVSNQPPPPGVKGARASRGDEGGSDLPAALREPVQKFPVSLYVAAQCKEVCDHARSVLVARGIPYVEKSVDAPGMLDELKRASGESAIPTLLVGRQAATGFEPGGWHQLLDLAGYPVRPVPGYRPPKPAAPAPAAKPADPDAEAAPAR